MIRFASMRLSDNLRFKRLAFAREMNWKRLKKKTSSALRQIELRLISPYASFLYNRMSTEGCSLRRNRIFRNTENCTWS